MAIATEELNTMQANYRTAVAAWIKAIQREEELAARDHSIIEVDEWEQAGFTEEGLRVAAKTAKKQYEDALRQEFYGFHGK
jgi:hypothetical protein